MSVDPISGAKIVYIVSIDSPSSVPLELAQRLRLLADKLDIIIFKSRNQRTKSRHFKYIGAKSCFDPVAVKRLYEYIIKSQPELIHVHHTASSFWAPLLSKMSIGAKTIRTEHNSQVGYDTHQNLVHTVSQALSDFVICNSKSTYNSLYLLQEKIVGEKYRVIYNGVNTGKIDKYKECSASDTVPKHDLLLGSVGRLVEQKNYSRLIGAFSLLQKKIKDPGLLLVGGGEKYNVLKNKIEKLGLGDSVYLTREVSRKKVYSYLHAIDIFVIPSLWEGFCNAVVEAMAAGLPVACSDIPTLREVVGPFGRFFDPERINDISSVIADLSIDVNKGNYKFSSSEIQSYARKNYSIERAAKKYLNIYRKCLSR